MNFLKDAKSIGCMHNINCSILQQKRIKRFKDCIEKKKKYL